MKTLHPIDTAIIVAYLVLIVVAGIWFSKRAARNLESYFLGGKNIPWFLLSISNASGMFDITGTMWMVTLLFVYGMKSVWIPWLWPSFNQVFLMIYLAVWLRRSNVLTGAEWIKTRFGNKLGAELAHLSVVLFALIAVIGFLAYAFQGIGKFSSVFLPWDMSFTLLSGFTIPLGSTVLGPFEISASSAESYALIFMGITTIYVILGGMYSVVLTDVIQFIILTAASFCIGAIAIAKVSPELLKAAIPDGWMNLSFGTHLQLDWSQLIPSVNDKIASDGFSLFGLFFMMILFKGILSSMAGPAPNYDMQRILATRTPRESALMSWFVSVILYFPRYLMIGGIGILALVFFSKDIDAMGPNVDFEQILPYVINRFIPTGIVGLLLAGLLAAFMSTFDSTVNAGAAYLVNDIYKRYINPNATSKRYIRMSYICSILVVAVGVTFGFYVTSIHSVLQWITVGLWTGYIAANILKWHWWRFNGYGYFAGMIVGIVAAALAENAFPVWFPETAQKLHSATNGFPHVLALFPVVLLISTAASVITSLLTPPTDDQILKSFYQTVRPWGLWHPIHLKVLRSNPLFHATGDFTRDMTNIAVGIVWQTTFAVMPLAIIIRQYKLLWLSIATLLVTSIYLKANWFDKLERD